MQRIGLALMNSKWEKLQKTVMYLSAKARKERLLSYDRKQYLRLQEMSDLDLKLTYIDIKSKYEYQKNMLILFSVSMVIAVLVNVWRDFGSFLRQIVELSSAHQETMPEAVTIGFIIALIIAAAITFLAIVLLMMYIREVYCLYKKLLMIEEIRKVKLADSRVYRIY